MIVEQIMHKNCFTLRPDQTVRDAVNLMTDQKIRHVPITNNENELIGIVTDLDVKEAMPSSLSQEDKTSVYEAPVSQIMCTDPFYAHPLDFVEEIALSLFETKKSAIPVVSNGLLVGIVTTSDLLHTYMELTGTTIPSSKIDIRVKNRPGLLYEITDILKAHHINVISVLVYADRNDMQYSIVSLRIRKLNPIQIIEALRQGGFDVLWPHMPGVTI
jgi:acetoin utilization protein AcuB